MLKHVQGWTYVLIISCFIIIIGNWIGYSITPIKALPGILVLMLIALVGLIIHRILPFNLPSIAYIGMIGFIITIPQVPGSEKIVEWTSQVDLLAITTPILAYAGISIGNSLTDFAKLGWKTIIVGMCVLLGTYLGSAIIAEIVLRLQGVI